MSVYVDSLAVYGGSNAPVCFRYKPSCHMYADTDEELHVMAKRIGLKKEWFQNKKSLRHYDLTQSKRKLAVICGAVVQTRKQLFGFMLSQRMI